MRFATRSRLHFPARPVRGPALQVAAVCMLSAGMISAVRAGDEPSQDARAWLERMSQSLATRNYDVRFLHLVGGHAENMRIVHRVANGATMERLVSLDGSGREVIRTDTEVVCYLPDRRQVLVEKRAQTSSLLAAIPAYSEELQSHYVLSAPGTTRILGRPAQVVAVQPRDNFRYGYRLWLDHETAMPLKSQLYDRSGRVIEQIVFSDISLPATIESSVLKSSIATEGFQWIRQETRAPRAAAVDAESGNSASAGWTVVNAPQGFRVTVKRTQTIVGASGPVRHLVLSDGLASVSVFIEPKSAPGGTTASKPISELARVGSALAYSTETPEHRITAVGEVPADTLRAIASSVQRETPATADAPAR